MCEVEATAEVFLAAFRSLRKAERNAVVARMAEDRKFIRDVLDLATIAGRRNEPRQEFRTYLANRKKRTKRAR